VRSAGVPAARSSQCGTARSPTRSARRASAPASRPTSATAPAGTGVVPTGPVAATVPFRTRTSTVRGLHGARASVSDPQTVRVRGAPPQAGVKTVMPPTGTT
jgi:hypothetical protein